MPGPVGTARSRGIIPVIPKKANNKDMARFLVRLFSAAGQFLFWALSPKPARFCVANTTIDRLSKFGWIGDAISLGAVEVTVTEMTKRWGITLIAQPERQEQPEILRTMPKNTNSARGTYCDPKAISRIEIGCVREKLVG
ncbi:hypothetical protein ACFVTJ_17075 [Agrobacterium sp. NPDC058088]|uniref:hypothetical protein n=1 Tax=Agrobacterium sp. NPDC058088 TaxID=3346335 RepID=UPI0036D9C737